MREHVGTEEAQQIASRMNPAIALKMAIAKRTHPLTKILAIVAPINAADVLRINVAITRTVGLFPFQRKSE